MATIEEVSRSNRCFDLEAAAGSIAHLKLDLLTAGARLSNTVNVEARGARPVVRTRAGLASGLELLLPGDLWVNVPVTEAFAARSPYVIATDPPHGDHAVLVIRDERIVARATLAPRPNWYDAVTTTGRLMRRIATLQGSYLAVYVGNVCGFWAKDTEENCRFCSVGLNVGREDAAAKSDDEIVETAKAARAESGITYVDLNAGHSENPADYERVLGLAARLKRETGLLIGVQTLPHRSFEYYDRLKAVGVNRVSFCFEVFDAVRFAEVCPGKARAYGHEHFLEAIRYCAALGRDASPSAPWVVNGEMIAGLEPVASTIRGIDALVGWGAVPTVCTFRPLTGTALEEVEPPAAVDLSPVFERLFEATAAAGLPIGMAPNVGVSIVMLPEECEAFSKRSGLRLAFRLRRALGRLPVRWALSRAIRAAEKRAASLD